MQRFMLAHAITGLIISPTCVLKTPIYAQRRKNKPRTASWRSENLNYVHMWANLLPQGWNALKYTCTMLPFIFLYITLETRSPEAYWTRKHLQLCSKNLQQNIDQEAKNVLPYKENEEWSSVPKNERHHKKWWLLRAACLTHLQKGSLGVQRWFLSLFTNLPQHQNLCGKSELW